MSSRYGLQFAAISRRLDGLVWDVDAASSTLNGWGAALNCWKALDNEPPPSYLRYGQYGRLCTCLQISLVPCSSTHRSHMQYYLLKKGWGRGRRRRRSLCTRFMFSKCRRVWGGRPCTDEESCSTSNCLFDNDVDAGGSCHEKVLWWLAVWIKGGLGEEATRVVRRWCLWRPLVNADGHAGQEQESGRMSA